MRVTNRLIIGSLTVLGLLIGCSKSPSENAKQSGTFAYDSVYAGSGFMIDQVGQRVHLGDVALPAKFCDQNSGFYCVSSAVFNFAVPMKLDPKQTGWEQDGSKYAVVAPLRTGHFMGNELQFMIISSLGQKDVDKPAPTIFYFYSPMKGLLGTQSRSPVDDAFNMNFLSSDIGFAAAGS